MIRRGTPADAAAVAGVSHRVWRDAYAPFVEAWRLSHEPEVAEWEGRLGHDHYATLVFERDGEVLGFVSFGPTEPEDREPPGTGIVLGLYVETAAQGAGVGGALLDAACGAMRADGMHQVVLWTFVDNAQARGFYDARGWTAEPGSEVPHARLGALEIRYRRRL